jgi:hypothetical protein
MATENGKSVSDEKVMGNEHGITKVEAVSELLGEGRLRTRSRFLKNGQWVDGHSFLYTEEPAAQVIFKRWNGITATRFFYPFLWRKRL